MDLPTRVIARVMPAGLVARARWLLSVFTVFIGVVWVVHAPTTDVPAGRRTAMAVAAIALIAWAVHRYRHASDVGWDDLLPPAIIVTIAWAMQDPVWAFAPLTVALYQRAVDGSQRIAIVVGAAAFATWHLAVVVAGAVDTITPLAVATSAAGTAVTVAVLHGLKRLLVRYEAAKARADTLTETSFELLRATCEDEIADAACRAAYALVGQEDAGASMWLPDQGELVLVGEAGPRRSAVRRFPLDTVPSDCLDEYVHGAPFTTDERTTSRLEAAFGQPHAHASFAVMPLTTRSGGPGGAVVVGTSTPIDRAVGAALTRFANEVSLALDRARLVSELERANAELRAAADAKERFVATVSHELRSPLTTICGLSEVLQHRWDELDDPDRQAMIQRIRRQGERQRRLVENLLLVSQMTSGTLQARPEDTRLADLVAESVAGLATDPEPIVDVPADLEARVDPDHLQQMVENLLTNAARHGEPPYEIAAERRGPEIALRVADHGPGVPRDFQPVMFDRFQQQRSSGASGKGVGLGLAIVRELAEANGGAVVYHTRDEPSGAVFTLLLPAPTADVDAAETAIDDGPAVPAGTAPQ